MQKHECESDTSGVGGNKSMKQVKETECDNHQSVLYMKLSKEQI